jgi:ADP-heptose:LPS heptosyltransferase
MSGAIECLHNQHPNKYATDVQTSADAMYEHNPRITKLAENESNVTIIKMEYPLINSCNQRPVHFLQGYVDYLADQLKVKLTCSVNRPFLHLSEDEKKWLPQVHETTNKPIKYWIINSGVKNDYTAKGWGHENYQKVVNLLHGKVQFVQIGEKHHKHPRLQNAIDMIGKTNTRQLIRMCYHAEGGLGPITFIQHVFAAFQKPYVCLLGGREPLQWENYVTQTTMSTLGTLSCCRHGGCWVSRVIPLNDGDSKDKSLCHFPVFTSNETAIPKCMAMITPESVVDAIERYYTGGLLNY